MITAEGWVSGEYLNTSNEWVLWHAGTFIK